MQKVCVGRRYEFAGPHNRIELSCRFHVYVVFVEFLCCFQRFVRLYGDVHLLPRVMFDIIGVVRLSSLFNDGRPLFRDFAPISIMWH